MSDTKISALASGAPATLADLLAIARSGNSRSLSVQDVLTAISLLTASAPAAPADLLLANRGGAAVRLAVDDFLSLAPKRNYLDNGGFEVNQRAAASYALTTALAYGLVDRWAFKMATSAAGTATQVSSGLAGLPKAVKLTRTAGSALTGALTMAQLVESIDATRLQGKTVTLVWRAKAGANFSAASGNMSVLVTTGTGADEGLASYDAGTWTGAATPVNATQAISTTAGTYSRSFAVGSSATELAVQFGFTPAGTAGADDSIVVTDAWIVEGSNPPNNYGQDPYGLQLLRCQRFLPVWSASLGNGDRIDGFATSATVSFPRFDFKVQPRKAPTAIQISALADFTIFAWKNSGNFAPTALAMSTAGVNHSQLTATTTAGSPTIAAGDPVALLMANTNARVLWAGVEL